MITPAVTVLHIGCFGFGPAFPASTWLSVSVTGSRNTGLLAGPVDQPTANRFTSASPVNQLWPHSWQTLRRTIWSASLLLIAAVRWRLQLHFGHNMGTMGQSRPRTMDFGQWLAVEIPPEKQFQIEADCRRLEKHPQAGSVAAQLLRQCYHQQEMLQAAVNEIARLELELM
jgi:hypothetical protein